MSFDKCFTRLLGNEGGYSNNPADPGGETMWGITKAVAQENGYTGAMKDMPVDVAKAIYRKKYWDWVGIVNLPEALQFDVFDGVVNSGPVQAIKWLQRAVGVKDDGVLGHITFLATNMLPPAVVLARYNGERLKFMADLSTWPTFGKGWARRIAKNLTEV